MMKIPHFSELRKPILLIMQDGKTRKKSEFTKLLADYFQLSDDAVAQEYESGNGSIFIDRISWALSYFVLSGLLERPKRGFYVINEAGRIFADKSETEINDYVRRKMSERENRKPDGKTSNESNLDISIDTPQERLYANFNSIREEVCDDILQTILSKTSAAFEKLVVELLQKMGYGGAIEKSGYVSKRSRDGGIDGEIREDVLGLGKIHIQAKRYQRDTTIGRPEIQNFAGALLGQNANKGVFITTARYSEDAKKYAETLSTAKIVLIDGQKLAEYIYQYGLGVQIVQTLNIKKLDADYWDNIPNDE